MKTPRFLKLLFCLLPLLLGACSHVPERTYEKPTPIQRSPLQAFVDELGEIEEQVSSSRALLDEMIVAWTADKEDEAAKYLQAYETNREQWKDSLAEIEAPQSGESYLVAVRERARLLHQIVEVYLGVQKFKPEFQAELKKKLENKDFANEEEATIWAEARMLELYPEINSLEKKGEEYEKKTSECSRLRQRLLSL